MSTKVLSKDFFEDNLKSISFVEVSRV